MEIGIVGLPQSGKSALLKSLTGSSTQAGESGGVAFGVFNVPDPRVDWLAEQHQPKKVTPATVRFSDMVGRHGMFNKGELFTGQQLGHLRDMDGLVLVLRCFVNDAVMHPLQAINPARDLELVLSELVLADLAVVERRLERIDTDIRKQGSDKDAVKLLRLQQEAMQSVYPALNDQQPARVVALDEDHLHAMKGFCLLSQKPLLVLANMSDQTSAQVQSWVGEVREACGQQRGWDIPEPLLVNAALEVELREMFGPAAIDTPEAREFFQSMGLEHTALPEVISAGYQILGLITFLTAGEKEVRAWPIPEGALAPQAAGTIHSDFEKGFIGADVVAFDALHQHGTMAAVRKAGLLRREGRAYQMVDGDVVEFHFSV